MKHPQSDHPKAMMYKVLAEVVEEKGEITRGEQVSSVGGRVRSAEAKKAVAKAIAGGVNELESMGLVDLKTGEIKTKKRKGTKEKTPAELLQKELKTYQGKNLISMHACTTSFAFLFYCMASLWSWGFRWPISKDQKGLERDRQLHSRDH